MDPVFDHKKLEVCQRAGQFTGWTVPILEKAGEEAATAYSPRGDKEID